MIGSLTEPKIAGRIGKFQNHSGRKITSAPSGEKKESRSAKVNANASIDEIDKILEADAIALLNIKKEISLTQNEELFKLQDSLLTVRKEYDTLLVANNSKEREYMSMVDKYNSLVNVDLADTSDAHSARAVMQRLQDTTAEVLDDLAAEQRTLKMQTLMIKRLDNEIGKCRMDISKALVALEHAKHDMTVSEGVLQANRQELIDQEAAYEKLQQTLKSRKDQRESKMGMLNSLSLEGESSVLKLQSSLNESARRSAAMRSRKNTTRGKTGSAKADQDLDDDFLYEDELQALAKNMNATQLREVVQRFQSQASRIEKLTQQDQELRSNITLQIKKKNELTEHLTQTQFKIQQLASARQIYQEVDLKDSALAATSKACEEAKEKDFRLRLSIEELKQSIPRFLTKVTKVAHPKPNENQLGDAILKLEDELTKLIKVIGVALLKDATPDDLAMMSQQSNGAGASAGQSGQAGGNEANSEYGRLTRLPGFSRMQRQLFFNLMTAKPDISEHNIRIDQKVSKPTANKASEPSPRVKRGMVQQQSTSTLNSSQPIEDFGGVTFEDPREMSLDRNTIKNISKLIYERDQGKSLVKTAVETK
ncbi:hypothetical protein EON64_01770 [archaeon]|nr:MAG: hypothetical protein EON64_01770 [archaeon]